MSSWGRLEDTLHDEPKFYRAADKLGISFVEVAGHMAVLWSWAHRHAPDGDLRDYDVPDIERAAKWDGDPGVFVSVLVDDRVNLIDVTDTGYVLHRFMQRAEARKAAKKKQKQRTSLDKKKPVPGQSLDSPGNVPEERRREREEKRREISNTPPAAPAAPQPGYGEAVEAWFMNYVETHKGEKPPWGPVQGRQMKNILAKCKPGELPDLIAQFFHGPYPDAIKAGHSLSDGFACLAKTLDMLRADLANPERRARAAALTFQIRRAERNASNDDAAEEAARRLEAKARGGGNGNNG